MGDPWQLCRLPAADFFFLPTLVLVFLPKASESTLVHSHLERQAVVPVRQQYLVTHRRPNRPKLITIPVEDNDLTRTLEDNNPWVPRLCQLDPYGSSEPKTQITSTYIDTGPALREPAQVREDGATTAQETPAPTQKRHTGLGHRYVRHQRRRGPRRRRARGSLAACGRETGQGRHLPAPPCTATSTSCWREPAPSNAKRNACARRRN